MIAPADLTTKAAEIRAGLVERLRRAVTAGEDGCGTLPAKKSVKVRPVDWHRITRLAREAAALIEQQAAELDLERRRHQNTRDSRERWKVSTFKEQRRATTAESERDELLREKERLGRQLRALAIALHAKHYGDAPGWMPLDDAEGLLSQIDNMTTGLSRAAPSALENGPAGLADANSKDPRSRREEG